jgi:hypothetical protein
MADDKHTPYNTAPMSLEEREKELAKSGSGTPLSSEKKKGKKGKKKAKMGGGSEPT